MTKGSSCRYTLLLFLFEYRAATLLIKTQFPGPTAASITKIELDNDVISLDGRDPLRTESETDGNGRIRVRIRRSTSSAPESALSSSICLTPRPSNLSNAEIFSVNTPAPFYEYSINPNANNGYTHYNHGPNNEIIICNGDLGFGYRSGTSPRLSGYASSDAYSLQPTPRASNFNELDVTNAGGTPYWVRSPVAGKFFRQPSPAVPDVRMVWGESPGKCQNGGAGAGKDITGTNKLFHLNCVHFVCTASFSRVTSPKVKCRYKTKTTTQLLQCTVCRRRIFLVYTCESDLIV